MMRRLVTRLRILIALVLVLVCVTEIRHLWRSKVEGEHPGVERLSVEDGNIDPLVKSQQHKADKSSGKHKEVTKKPTSYPISDFLDDVIADLSRPWIANRTRQIATRKNLNSAIDARKFAILTKNFTKVGQNLTFALNPKITHKLTKEIYDMLPEESPFADLKFKRCRVIGNSGILANSYCGEEIDKSDYVFRCNIPPIKEYQKHAGTKANIASINPSGVINARYKHLKEIAIRNKFLSDMKAYNDLLFPLYGVNPGSYTTSLLALRLLQQKGSSTRPIIINPDHFKALQRIWNKIGLKSRMTTGFYLVSVALSVCDSTDLFGFWPFATDTSHRPLAYHYYDKMKITNTVHNYNWEFNMLRQMHTNGVLRMRVGSCARV